MIRNIVVLFILSSAILLSQPKQSQLNLNSTYQIKVGDYAAILLKGFIGGSSKFYAPLICTYEPEPNTIDVEIYDEKSDVEGARESINQYWSFIKSSFIPYAQRRLGVSLNEFNFRIMVYDRTAVPGTKLILQYINGQFVVPSK
jgi:hypothetical protein